MIKENIFQGFDWNDYFTLPQMMEQFGVSKSTIYYWRSQGLKTTKCGGKPIFHKSNISEYFNRSNS